jgi:hypothetical protein
MADFGTKLLEMLQPNIAAANGEAPAVDPAAPAAEEEPKPAELAELERQLAIMQAQQQSQQLMQYYFTDLQNNPAAPQPAGLLAGYDHPQALAAHMAQYYGQPAPAQAYTGPTLMDLKRLEQAQHNAQGALYAASRP